jgi:glycosyltransferase involved in cell wall biosynthesis
MMFGSERALLDLLPSLQADWDITVCCPPGLFAEAAEKVGVAVRPTFTPYLHQKGRVARLRAALGLRRVIKDVKPGLIHVNQAGAAKLAAFAAGRDLPIVIHTRLFEDYEYLRTRGLEKRACAIICVSEAMKKEAVRILDAPTLFRLYDPYAPTCGAQPANQSSRTLVCIGRLGKIKGQDLLLGAMAELKKQGVEVNVVFVGSAPKNSGYDNDLKEMSRGLGIEGQVQWLGFKANVFDDLPNAAALLVPSERETLGRVIFEAWDAGTVPVVWQGSGGAAEVVEASGGGIIFQERTPAVLAEAIRTALNLPQTERASLVTNGRTWLVANHQPAQIARDLSKIWQGCIQAALTRPNDKDQE